MMPAVSIPIYYYIVKVLKNGTQFVCARVFITVFSAENDIARGKIH